MSGDTEFRSPEQEVLRLLDECAELRRTLKSISAQVGRMEIRVKRAFPVAAELARDRTAKGAQSSTASISSVRESILLTRHNPRDRD